MKKIISLAVFHWVVVPALVFATAPGSGWSRQGESSQEEQVEIVVITASRLWDKVGFRSRRVRVVSRGELASWSGASLADILVRSSALDMRRRGSMQADLSWRGAGFERVLVLVDGVVVSDPQTGHHNLDIPISSDDIDHIQVIPGAGSSVFGPGAYSAVVNIITRYGMSGDTVLRASGGSFGSIYSSLSLAARPKNDKRLDGLMASSRFSAAFQKSDGHRHGTEYASMLLSHAAMLLHPGGTSRLRIGFEQKQFGAEGFYASYPSKEHTKTFLALLSSSLGDRDQLEVIPRISFRRHHDHFVLDRNQPSLYKASHISQIFGAELALKLNRTRFGSWVIGIDHGQHALESQSLGNHNRHRTSAFFEHQYAFSQSFLLNWGARLDWGRSAKEKHFGFFSPSVTAKFLMAPGWVFLLSTGRGFRLPSFTELYYQSPANVGDPTLGLEESWAGDLSVVWEPNHTLGISFSGFFSWESNPVDWIKDSESEPWRVSNLESMVTAGGEVRLHWTPTANNSIEIGYIRMGLSKDSPASFSKYFFRQPVDDVLVRVRTLLSQGFKWLLSARYRRQKNEDGQLLLDARLIRCFENLEVYLELANLLDSEIEEIPGAPLPGFSWSVGMSLTGW